MPYRWPVKCFAVSGRIWRYRWNKPVKAEAELSEPDAFLRFVAGGCEFDAIAEEAVLALTMATHAVAKSKFEYGAYPGEGHQTANAG